MKVMLRASIRETSILTEWLSRKLTERVPLRLLPEIASPNVLPCAPDTGDTEAITGKEQATLISIDSYSLHRMIAQLTLRTTTSQMASSYPGNPTGNCTQQRTVALASAPL